MEDDELSRIVFLRQIQEKLRPDVLFKNIPPEELKEMWRGSDIDDLGRALKIFEEYEMYTHCKAIKDLIDES
jgi:hypothetical protein